MKLQLYNPNINITKLQIQLLGITLICITACSVLKEKKLFRSDSLSKHSIFQNLKERINQQTRSVKIHHSSDSLHSEYITEIFPNGYFTYSVHDGFKGIAEKVLIKGSINKSSGSRTLELADSKMSKDLKVIRAESSKIKKTLNQQNLNKVNYLNCALLVCLVLLIAFLARYCMEYFKIVHL
ncbi:MAG: hypothetical protein ABI390_05565 [Daejeonella sp.]